MITRARRNEIFDYCVPERKCQCVATGLAQNVHSFEQNSTASQSRAYAFDAS
jgi:hypothetical protein